MECTVDRAEGEVDLIKVRLPLILASLRKKMSLTNNNQS